MQRMLIIAGAVAAVVILILANALYIVPVDKQAIVLRLGEAQYTVNATQPGMAEAGVPMANAPAGLHFKVPLLEDVRFYEKRNQGFELDAAEVIANDQQRLFVDAIARWRIRDPLQYLRASGGQGEQQLARVSPPPCAASSAGQPARHHRRPARHADAARRVALQTQVNTLGIEVVDVRIRQADPA